MRSDTKCGRCARGTVDGAGAGGRCTGMQTLGGTVGGIVGRREFEPLVTFATGPWSDGVAVIRHVK